MLQIKTVWCCSAGDFDAAVNEALEDGWMLTRRGYELDGFVAELEKVVITEAEKCCDNCAHSDAPAQAEPCCRCEDASHWEAIV